MSQQTFWEGEERIEARAEVEYQKTAAKIRLTNLLEEDLKKEVEKARPPKPRRDFRIGARQPEPEKEEAAEEVVEAEERKAVTAEHVAAQLVKLWRMGVISGAEDPEAVFYAGALKEFGGTVREVSDHAGKRGNADPSLPETPLAGNENTKELDI